MADNTYEEVRGFVMWDQNHIENEFHFILKSKFPDELKINLLCQNLMFTSICKWKIPKN